ncbi:MAG: flagellar biosynthetic protein FliO [Planctomycetota bacterium]|jgi:flagellar biogenesis protein FliO|nr:hypothetical protein [Planctomycetota bacterium]MDP6839453.1 flagellar biosynthetic protein FliO [Planctomycetota bacterium]MDP6955109.1 flagellar biosynthetic protein FliO [Planctomycetota bacterium]
MHNLTTIPLALLNQDGPAGSLGGTQGPDLTRYIFVCGFLVIATLGLAWGFRRLFADSLRARAKERHLAVLDVLPLGKGRQVSVVRCFDRTFALGLAEKSVSLIAELDAVVGQEQVCGQEGAVDLMDFNRLLESSGPRQPVRQADTTPARIKDGGVVA